MAEFSIKAIDDTNREWVRGLWRERWGASIVVSRGKTYHADELTGFMALFKSADENAPTYDDVAGLITYHIDGTECEIVTLDSLQESIGIGARLIQTVQATAHQVGCRRLWLITTNDNLHALRFYQRRGFVLVALYPNAIAESRRIKPAIPLHGNDGIPIRDEIELEIRW